MKERPGRCRQSESSCSSTNTARRRGLPRKLRLRKRREFLAVQRRGRNRNTPHFVVISIASPVAPARFGVTVSKRVGNAVVRNHVKRRVREFYRLHRERLPVAQDLVFVARRGAGELSYAEIARELRVGAGIDPSGGDGA